MSNHRELVAIASALFAGCASMSLQPPPGSDAAPPVDEAPPPSRDGGPVFDEAPRPAGETLHLSSPTAFASRVAPPPTIEFIVDTSAIHADVEAAITVGVHGGADVAGSFSWHAPAQMVSRTAAALTFTPNTPLAADTDYVVTVTPSGSFNPIGEGLYDNAKPDAQGRFHAPFSTGSNPRLVRVVAISKELPSFANIDVIYWEMSEPMDTASLSSGFAVTVNGTPVAGSLSAIDLSFKLATPVPLATVMTYSLELGPQVTALTGTPLNPNSWDSPTLVNGHFSLTLNDLWPCDMQSEGPGCWEWRPIVKN
jgi:hypothetical protein